MTVNRTTLLDLPLPVTGTESGTWGNVTNNGLTQYLDIAIAGALSVTSSVTLDTTEGDSAGTNIAGTTAQYRTLLVPASGPSGNIVITAPASNRTYHVVNLNATHTVQVRAGAGTGVTIGVNQSATVAFDGTDYTLVGTYAPIFNVDNLRLDGNTISSTNTNGNIELTPNGSGGVVFPAGAVGTPAITTSGDTNTGIFFPAADTIAFAEGGAEAMRIDSSGRLLVGSTSATASGGLLQIGVVPNNSSSSIGFNNNDNAVISARNSLVFQVNSDNNISDRFFQWRNGGKGYGDGTHLMTLDASGNLGVGTTSPGSFAGAVKLVVGSAATTTTPGAVTVYSGTSTYGGLYFADGTVGDQLYRGAVEYNHSTDALLFYSTGSERMRIDSAGKVLIGASSSDVSSTSQAMVIGSGGLAVQFGASTGTYLKVNPGNANGVVELAADARTGVYPAMTFKTSDTERMRIDSSGNLLVGTTTTNGRLVSKASTANGSSNAFYASNSSDTELCFIRSDGLFGTGLAANSPYNYTTGSAANIFINSSGEFQRSTSSLKYKTEIQDATHGLAEVMQLRSVTYKGKNDGNTIFGGLIAEEVHEAGLTEFVQYADDGTPDALAYGNMVSLAFKAIQELKAELDTVKAELATLKG